jgi:hypothetical protein
MSGRCFLPKKECKFVIDIIDSIYKLLDYNLNVYGSLVASLTYTNKAASKNSTTLDLDGYVAVVYFMRYNEPYPKNPTLQQKYLINAIWEALGHPEKKIPV